MSFVVIFSETELVELVIFPSFWPTYLFLVAFVFKRFKHGFGLLFSCFENLFHVVISNISDL